MVMLGHSIETECDGSRVENNMTKAKEITNWIESQSLQGSLLWIYFLYNYKEYIWIYVIFQYYTADQNEKFT
jgi:hypothetical protein